MILLSKFVVGSENLDYYKNDCYGTTEENYLKSASYLATLSNAVSGSATNFYTYFIGSLT